MRSIVGNLVQAVGAGCVVWAGWLVSVPVGLAATGCAVLAAGVMAERG